MINPAIFRAYDIRGNSHRDLSPEIAYKIGFAFTQNLIRNVLDHDDKMPLVCIGQDGRLSSQALCNALMRGVQAAGGQIKYIGLGPTPMLYYADRIFAAKGSIMVTGSHNPKDDNGFKMVQLSNPFFGPMIQNLKAQIELLDERIMDGINETTNLPEITDIKEEYIRRILQGRKINPALKIVFDPANGSGGEIAEMLCRLLPCQASVINGAIDGNFPAHDPDPTIATNLAQLKDYVMEKEYDLGIGFDGDADRIGVVTAKGRFVAGDQLLCLYAKDVISKHPGATVIADVKTGSGLFDYVKQLGGKGVIWKTGHSFIKSKMKEIKAKLAGEMSGHIFFADDYYGYDDALYGAVRLIDIISNAQETIDEMINRLPKLFNTPEIKIPVSDERKFTLIKDIQLFVENQNMDFLDIDGIRVNTSKGWWLLRASNTGPYIIARCESTTREGLHILHQDLKLILSKYNINL